MKRSAYLLPMCSGLALFGCGRGNVNIEAPGISIHTSSSGVNVSAHDSDQGFRAVGETSSESRLVSQFHGLEAHSTFQVHYTKGSTSSLKITAKKDLFSHIKSSVEDGVLHLTLEGNVDDAGDIVVEIENPSLDQITMDGASHGTFSGLEEQKLHVEACGGASVTVEGTVASLELSAGGAAHFVGKFQGETELEGDSEGGAQSTLSGKFSRAKFSLTSASQVTIDGIQAQSCDFDVDSASRLTAKGTTDSLELKAEGAGDLDLGELIAQSCQVQAEGGAHAKLNVAKDLTANASGAAHIEYSGSPHIQQNLDGAASLTQG